MTPESAKRGKWGEDVAAEFLAAQGYAIRHRNWRMEHYELDIVAQQGNEIIFVEVKMRQGPNDDPIEAVNKRKRARMISSADVYLYMIEDEGHFEYRFDIIGITGTPDSYEIEHIPDAFLPSLTTY